MIETQMLQNLLEEITRLRAEISSLKVTLPFWGKRLSWAEPPAKLSLVLLVGSECCGQQCCSSVLVAPTSSTVSQLCGHDLPCRADTSSAPVGDGSLLSCALMWSFPFLAHGFPRNWPRWLWNPVSRQTGPLRALVRTRAAWSPCLVCPVHSLPKDGWGCPHTRSCADRGAVFLPTASGEGMAGFCFFFACPLLPPSTLSPVGEAVTRHVTAVTAICCWASPAGQGDADRTG